ncbi:uncharacterized protein [Antedon mediterranea]|uniref:uncharacterized protein n=1 Tax=Antedon mediterranea TaxID=105859 RepID=UPI003AF5C43B
MNILIIVSFDVPSLVNSICKSIGQLPYFICKYFAGSGYRDISSQLDHCNCLVLKESQIGEDFPWAHFSLVVGYAHRIESPWEEMCNRQNIRYIALKMVWPPHNDKNHLGTSTAGETEPIVNAVIGSSAVTSNHHLLQLLEARFNFQVLERDYLTDQSASTCQSFPDIVIDERTCIILLPSKQLTEENAVDFVINRIVGLSLQCCYCAVFICNDDASASYTYSGQMINNLARLHAVAAQYSPSTNDFEIKILYCYSQEQTAQLVRSVADASLERNLECKRYKLSETISKQEKFLLSLPCFNSISAQQVLSTHGLRSIFHMSLPNMMKTFAWLPNKVLEGLYSIMHRNEDIKPKLDLPFTENIPLDCREEGKAKSMASYDLHPKPSEIKVEPFEFPSLDFKKNEFHDFGTKDSIEHSVSRNLFPDKYEAMDQQYEHAMKGWPTFQDSNRFCIDNRITNQPATFEHLPWDSHGIQSNMSGVSNSMSHHEHLAGDIFGNAVPKAFQSQQMNHYHTSPMNHYHTSPMNHYHTSPMNHYHTSPMHQFSTDLWNNARMTIPGNLETQNKYSTSGAYKPRKTFGNHLSEQSFMSGAYKPRNTFDNSLSEPSVQSGAYKTNNTPNHLLQESIMSGACKPTNIFGNPQSEQRTFRRDSYGYVGMNEMPFDRVTANTQQEQKDCRFPNRFVSSVQEDEEFNCAMARRVMNPTDPPNRKAHTLPWETFDAWKDP